MLCRNKDKAEEARAELVKETGNKVQYMSTSVSNQIFSEKNNDTKNLNIPTGDLCAHSGFIRDQEGLGVC